MLQDGYCTNSTEALLSSEAHRAYLGRLPFSLFGRVWFEGAAFGRLFTYLLPQVINTAAFNLTPLEARVVSSDSPGIGLQAQYRVQ